MDDTSKPDTDRLVELPPGTSAMEPKRAVVFVVAEALLASILVIVVAGYAALLSSRYPELYYRSVQEDEYVEWATFFTFVAAAVMFALVAARQRRVVVGRLPWFVAGLSLFCMLVACEEISWGQRLFGYAPPDYFLKNNFQQELNAHNVMSAQVRQWGVSGVLLGYGAIFPFLGLFAPVRRLYRWLTIYEPPWYVIPGFVTAFVIWVRYPWNYSGEWVELMMGLGFLIAASVMHRDYGPTPTRMAAAVVPFVGLWVTTFALGVGASVATDRLRVNDPALIAATQHEIELLQSDAMELLNPCEGRNRVHKRVYSYIERYGGASFLDGSFKDLTKKGLPESRADFFIDPWNSPYWLLCLNEGSATHVLIYSFGPNRRRESDDLEVKGDDIGLVREQNGWSPYGPQPQRSTPPEDDPTR